MVFKKHLYITALLLVLGILPICAQQSNIIRLLTDEWQVYDEEEGIYTPYLPNYYTNPSQLHLLLQTASLEDFYLTIKGKNMTHLFVNNQLLYVFKAVKEVDENVEVTLAIADLMKTQGDSTADLMLSLYAANGKSITITSTHIAKYSVVANISNISYAYWERKERPKNVYQGTLTFLGVGLLAVFAVFYRIPNPIFNLNYLSRYLSGFTKMKSEGGKINSLSFVLFGVFYALVFAYLFTAIQSFKATEFSSKHVSGEMLRAFSVVFSWIVLFLVIKFLLVWMVGMLYDNRKVFNIHVQEYMNTNQVFAIGLLVVAGVLHFSNGLSNIAVRENAFITTCIAMLISGLLVSYRINKTLPFKKVYLFSYLCGTEFFPVLVLIKFLVEQQTQFFST